VAGRRPLAVRRDGPEYTLLRFDPQADAGALLEAAARRKLPLAVLDVQAGAVPEAYRHALLISRPDQHVAWRGDRVPDDALALVDRLRGSLDGLDRLGNLA
jgi:hypothetical protein